MIKFINSNGLLKRITKKDDLFRGEYVIDPYKNCEFGCEYCDLTSSDVFVISNAISLLKKELSEARKGTIIIGSASEPYQLIERKVWNDERNYKMHFFI
jgi:DNA repair photolyase